MFTLRPAVSLIRSKIRLIPSSTLADAAIRRIEIAPSTSVRVREAIALPGQFERVTGYIFAPKEQQQEVMAGCVVNHDPTVAYVLRDALLVDGRIIVGNADRPIHPRTTRLPSIAVSDEIDSAAFYGTWNGYRYFGMWLAEDCPTYLLAEQYGQPLTADVPMSEHQRDYERLLDMKPRRSSSARIRELLVFDDYSHHEEKRARIREMGRRLIGDRQVRPHPGVFILRGRSGEHRVLTNEAEVAALAAEQRGLRVLDPMKSTTAEIVEACAGARMVMGVEGSAVMHAMPLLADEATVFILQPPNRFCSVYKNHADRDGHHFAYLVGVPDAESFHVDLDDVKRTLDLVDARVGS